MANERHSIHNRCASRSVLVLRNRDILFSVQFEIDTRMTSDAILGRTPRPLKNRLYVMMFLQYFVQGSYLPIISLYLQDGLGFTSTQLGIFGSALAVGPILSPFVLGQMVDRHFSTERVLTFCHAVGGIIMLVLYALGNRWLGDFDLFWPAFLLGTIYSTLYIPTLMLTNSLTFHHLADRDREFPMIRLWGTVGFVAPAWMIEAFLLKGLKGAELTDARGIALAVAGVAGLVMAGYSMTLPHTPPQKTADDDGFAPGKVTGLLRGRTFLMLTLVSLIVAVVHKFYFVWNSPFLNMILEKGEVTGPFEQRISSIGQISEVAIMAGLAFSIVRLGYKWTMFVGTIAYLVRCLMFAFASIHEGPFAVTMTIVCLGQALHGVCFGCFMAVAYMFVDKIASKDVRGSMQTFYGTFVIGLGFFIGGFIAGKLGEIMSRAADVAPFRDSLGIQSQAGLVEFIPKDANQTILRDWPGIWLSCAVLAVIACVAFALFFPSTKSAESSESS